MSAPENQKPSLWAVGLMLFALFFGAGNLIFPAFLGQQAGSNWLSAMSGFLLTGAGLPLLGVIAIGYSGLRDVQDLALRVTPWMSAILEMPRSSMLANQQDNRAKTTINFFP